MDADGRRVVETRRSAVRIVQSFRIAIVVAVLVACGQEERGQQTLVFGRGSDSIGLDPGIENDGESFKVCDNIYETLVTYDSESTAVVPQLAHSWDIADDQLTWTFHLRTGVRFHDGTPFNAEAMLFSLGRQFDKDHPFPQGRRRVQVLAGHGHGRHCRRARGPGRLDLCRPSQRATCPLLWGTWR